MTTIVRLPSLQVKVNDVAISNVISASTRHGYNMNTAEAEVNVLVPPTGIAPFDTVEVLMGASPATRATRFKGHYLATERGLYPATAKLGCKGHLIKAELYHCTTVNGIDMSGADLSNSGSTDTEYVSGMLNNAGIYDPPVTLTIGGLDRLMGTKPGNRGFMYTESQSALAWIQALDGICLGYRTYDTPAGAIVRSQVTALPSVTAAYTFTEGVDIFRASAQDSIIEAKNRIIVTGWSDGKKEDEAHYDHHAHWETQATNPWFTYGSDAGGWFYITHRLSSGMIEKSGTAPGDQLAAQEVAEWLLAELNVRRLRVTLTTHRDDQIAPGTTIAVASPTRMGITQNFWVQEVSCEFDASKHFTQTLNCMGVVADPA